jgi:hypothetical protein
MGRHYSRLIAVWAPTCPKASEQVSLGRRGQIDAIGATDTHLGESENVLESRYNP